MLKGSLICLALLCFIPIRNGSGASESTSRGEVRIMWYNVENLFYPTNDSIDEDDEFTPAGLRHWTWKRYHRKIVQLAKVIIAAGQWDPPDLVGLCEVENFQVLEDLVSHPILKSYEYKIIHRDSHDHRGMDVACLYREEQIKIEEWSAYSPVPSASFGRTRDMIHLCTTWGRGDTLDLFLIHFISKYGGVGATADYRKSQARSLVDRIDSVQYFREKALTVVAGDFNEEFEGYSMEPFRVGMSSRDTFWILSPGTPAGRVNIEGSYKYRGRWSLIDQFLVAGEKDHLRMEVTIMDLKVLFKSDELYQGIKPSRTYDGYYYNGGISDHLPVLLDISHYPFSTHFEQ